MQIVKQNIKRPTLFKEFFNHLLTWSNEIIDYISTTQKEPKAITLTYSRIILKTIKIFKINVLLIKNKLFNQIKKVFNHG